MSKWLKRRPFAGLTMMLSACVLTQAASCTAQDLVNTFVASFGSLLINSFVGSLFGGTGF